MTVPLQLGWKRREPPLPASAVVAAGAAVAALGVAAAARVDAGTELRGAVGGDWLLILGAEADLPWAEGVVYVGWDGGILVPTNAQTVPGADIVAPAVLKRVPPGCDLAVLLRDGVLASPRPARCLDSRELARIGAVLR